MQKFLHELNYKNIIFLCKNLKYRIHCDINITLTCYSRKSKGEQPCPTKQPFTTTETHNVRV